jgi:hypothetical protein
MLLKGFRADARVRPCSTRSAFIEEFRNAQAPLLAERSRAIGARIAELQRYLAVATGDDFRNTMAMANAARRELDAVERSVTAEVIASLTPDADSPLFLVWQAIAEQ